MTSWRNLLAHPPGDHDHIVQLYQDESFLRNAVCEFVAAGLRQRECVALVVTAAHWRAYRRWLLKNGFDVYRLMESGQILFLDAQHTLYALMNNGHPDRDAYCQVVGGAIEKLCSDARYSRVRAHGEMVNILWLQGNFLGALRLEELWNELAHRHSFTLLCSYFLDAFDPEPKATTRGVFHTHSHVIPVEDYARLESAVERAMRDVLGQKQAEDVKRHVGETPQDSWLPGAQKILYWLQFNLPHSAGDVYLRARRYYYAPASKAVAASIAAATPACD